MIIHECKVGEQKLQGAQIHFKDEETCREMIWRFDNSSLIMIHEFHKFVTYVIFNSNYTSKECVAEIERIYTEAKESCNWIK